MRAHPIFFVPALLSLVACGSDAEQVSDPSSPARGPSDTATAPPPAPTPPAPGGAEGVAIKGVVRAGFGSAGIRPVTVIDAKGRKQSVLTDIDGKFGTSGVVTPYDVVLAPRAANAPAVAYLGVSKDDIVLHALDGGSTPWRRHFFDVSVTVPACFTTTCNIAARSLSPDGSGAGNATYAYGQTTATVQIQHAFLGEATDGKATVHVLTSSGAFNAAQYGKLVDQPFVANGSTSLTVPMQAVSVAAAFRVHPPPVAAGWRTSMSPSVVLPDGASFAWLALPGGPPAQVILPMLPAAKLSVTFWAHDPVESTSAWAHERRSVASYLQAPVPQTAGAPVDVTVTASEPLELTTPRSEGVLAAGADIEWSGPSGSAQLEVANHATSGLFSVMTNERRISRARLRALGIEIEPGTSVLDLRTTVGASVDDSVTGVTSPATAQNATQTLRFTAQ